MLTHQKHVRETAEERLPLTRAEDSLFSQHLCGMDASKKAGGEGGRSGRQRSPPGPEAGGRAVRRARAAREARAGRV